MKKCNVCGIEKTTDRFSKKSTCKDGLNTRCKDCHNKYVREKWYPKNATKQKKSSKDWKLKNRARIFVNAQKNNNISIKDVQETLDKSNGKCEICGEKENAIDHCHLTMKIRGLLCTRCNLAIGMFDDNIDIFKKAILYLQKY